MLLFAFVSLKIHVYRGYLKKFSVLSSHAHLPLHLRCHRAAACTMTSLYFRNLTWRWGAASRWHAEQIDGCCAPVSTCFSDVRGLIISRSLFLQDQTMRNSEKKMLQCESTKTVVSLQIEIANIGAKEHKSTQLMVNSQQLEDSGVLPCKWVIRRLKCSLLLCGSNVILVLSSSIFATWWVLKKIKCSEPTDLVCVRLFFVL